MLHNHWNMISFRLSHIHEYVEKAGVRSWSIEKQRSRNSHGSPPVGLRLLMEDGAVVQTTLIELLEEDVLGAKIKHQKMLLDLVAEAE